MRKKTTSWKKKGGMRKKPPLDGGGGLKKNNLTVVRGNEKKAHSLWICEGAGNFFHKTSKYEKNFKRASLGNLILRTICS